MRIGSCKKLLNLYLLYDLSNTKQDELFFDRQMKKMQTLYTYALSSHRVEQLKIKFQSLNEAFAKIYQF